MSDAKAIPVTKTKAEKPAKQQSDLRRVLSMLNRFLVGNRITFVIAMVMLALNSLLDNLAAYPLPLFVAYLSKNTAPPPFDGPLLAGLFATTYTALGFIAALVILLAFLSSVTDSLSEIYLSKGGRQLGYNLRASLFGHLQKLSLAFFGRQRTGDLLTRVTSDVSAIEVFSIDSLKDIAGSVFTLLSALALLLLGSPLVAFVAVLMVPVLSVVSNYFADRIKALSKKVRAREGELAASTQEMLTSIRVIQTYGSGGNQLKQFADISQQTMDTALQAARLQAWFSGVFGVMQAVTIVLVAVIFTTLMGSQGYEPAQLLTFVGIITNTFKPTKRLIKQWNEVGKIIASVERIGDVLDRKPAVEDRPDAQQAPRFQGYIEFSHVSFAYVPEPEDVKEGQVAQPRLALRDVSFTVAPGEVVALVGGSGAGKSTIVQLLPRLYDPHAGAITFDGQDIRSFSLDSLRGQMSMVLQEAILFTGTVAENIAYGRQNATREEVVAAAMQASAHEFIQKMPDGYDTVLSERASNLSGGQRQRIAIARAFIRNTPILILDEPTTGLDAESTELVQLALRSLMRGKATVIISHDLNLIRQADKIIAIKEGAIEQVGSHKELLKRGGLYADLYNKQFGQVVQEQGGQMKSGTTSTSLPAPLPVAAIAPVDEDDDDVPQVTPRAFQTLIGKALPAPASQKAFQTLMMQAVVPPPPAATPAPVTPAPAAQNATPATPAAPAAPAPVAQDARPAPAPSARHAQVMRIVPLAPPQSDAAPTAEPAPPAAPAPVAPAEKAASAAPAATPSASTPSTKAPSTPPVPAPVAQAPVVPPASSAPPRPAPTAATGRTELQPAANIDGRSTMRFGEEDLRDLRASTSPATPAVQAGQAGRSGLRGERLDLLQSAAFQEEFPSVRTAFDAQNMREHIQAALFGKARLNYVIEKCELDQATYLPGEGVALRYEVTAKDRITLQTIEPMVIGMVFPNQLACALYMRDKLAPLVELMRGRPEITPFATPAAIIEPLHMILHVFPIDGELPALVPATDPQRMVELFRETLPEAAENTFDVERCKVELIDYARRNRSVLRYSIDGKQPGSARAERRFVYGKVFNDQAGALAQPVTAALRESVRTVRGGAQFAVPRALAWRPDMQLSLLEAIPGKPLISDQLKARLRGKPLPQGMLSLEEMIAVCAQIAVTMHTSNIKLGRRRTLDEELATLRSGVADMQRYSPDLAVRLSGWLDQLSAYAEQSDALPIGFCHGDFTYTQVIFEGTQSGLVDFDSVCQAEAALDLGHFLAYLRVAGAKAQQLASGAPSTLVNDLREQFLQTYIRSMGAQVEDIERLRVRVSVYQMVSLLRRALRSWQKFKGSRLESALAVIEEEMACLPQLDY